MEATFGKRRLSDFGRLELQEFLDDLADEYCHDTVHIALTSVRAIFNLVVEEDWMPKSPAQKLGIPARTRERDESILSFDEVRQLETELTGRDGIIWRLFSRCGLRAGEVFGLK
jgi:site-specific recombinase XerD